MPGVVTSEFRLNNAEQFFESFSEASPSIIYFFIARPAIWPDDGNPPTPLNTTRTFMYDVWRNMLGMKRVPVESVSYATDRNNWTTGTVYAQYEDNKETFWANNYYVMTEDFNVYKCLDNAGDSASTVKPSGTSNTAITTSDGYKWKYMYTVSAAKALKFLSTNYIPVQSLDSDDGSSQWAVQQSAANGGIEAISVTSGGSGYEGDTGAVAAANSSTATLETTGVADDGFVGSVIYISGGTGAGQLREIVDWQSSLKVATVNTAWSVIPDVTSTYIVGPKVIISGDGSSPASAYAEIDTGQVNNITVINKGANYSNASVVLTANNGTGATAHPQLSPLGGHGANAVSELSGYNVMLNVKLEGSEQEALTVENDFRVLGLIKDPLLANGDPATAIVYDQTTHLNVTGVSGVFAKDEIVIGATSTANAVVVEANSTVVRVTDISGQFTTETINGQDSGASATVNSITDPELLKFTGEVLYIENRSPISRASDQTEDFKVVIRF